MIKRIFSLTISLFIIMSFSSSAFAQSADAEGMAQRIIEYKTQDNDIQNFIDTTLTENAGVNAEWYVITLSQTGSYDFSGYEKSLSEYLENNRVSSASSRLKYALAFMAIGSDSSYILDNFDTSIGQQGIMSWVFGLHILNNGFESPEHSIKSVCEKIISLQLEDGGFAVSGDRGNADVTAMTISALAPYYESDADVKSSIDKALTFLSQNQNEYGGFESYGVYCSESTAQVLMALSSLGIDCTKDERFIKNDITILQSLDDFMLEDGSFSHELSADANDNATVQAYYCLSAYLKMLQGDNLLFVFEDNSVLSPPEKQPESDSSSVAEIPATTKPQKEASGGNLKAALIVGIIILVVFFFVVLFISKKKNVRNFLGVACIGAILVGVVLKLDIKTADEFYDISSKQNIIGTVTLEIVNPASKENGGVILPKTEYNITEDQTAYDILVEACAENKIHLETNGINEYAYVEGIDYIYEFDHGELSGWMYYVNKVSPSVSCSSYVLSDNDTISFIYTTQMGNDIVLE